MRGAQISAKLRGVTKNKVPLRGQVAQLPKYVPGSRPSAGAAAFKLSSNENPCPPLPAVLATLADVAADINRYPDMHAVALTERIAAKFDVGADQVAVGAGSVAVLGDLLTALLEPGDEVIYAWRSFEAYPILTAIAGGSSVQVPLTEHLTHDLPAMLAAITSRTKIILLCSPNNPTGTVIPHQDVVNFLAQVPRNVLVVLDEAYAEFVRDPQAVRGHELLADHPNLVVARTFSKAYGLAGLRVGYALGHPGIIAGAQAVKTPFVVSDLAQRAALVSLDAEEQLLDRVADLVEERTRVTAELAAVGIDIPPTEANFFWLPLGPRTGDFVELANRSGIMVRAFAGEGVRISIGEVEANNISVAVTAEFVHS